MGAETAMPTYRMRAKIKRGHVKLDVKTDLPSTEADVTVIVEPVKEDEAVDEKGWPIGFFERFAGALADNPIQRWPEGDFEKRKPFDDLPA
jgi:hypothetical protein